MSPAAGAVSRLCTVIHDTVMECGTEKWAAMAREDSSGHVEKGQVRNSLRLARLARKLSLEQLGQKVGISRGALWQIERETVRPSLETALRLSRALEVPIEVLFWLEEEGSSPGGSRAEGAAASERLVTAVLKELHEEAFRHALVTAISDQLHQESFMRRLRRIVLEEAQRLVRDEEEQASTTYYKSFV
jgi:putative transcriptional regulator